jgi:hypothetical protein
MITRFLIIIIIWCSASCSNSDRVPSNVLPAEKMEKVLWDMMRADNFVNDFLVRSDSTLNKDSESIKMYQRVFAIHETTQDEFRRSLTFYKEHPTLFKRIFDSLNIRTDVAPTQIINPTDTLKRIKLGE